MAARKEQSEPAPKASVNMDELRELVAVLRDNGLSELELENEGFRVRLRRDPPGVAPSHFTEPSAPVPSVAAPAPAPVPPPASGPAHPGTQATTEASHDQDL